MQEIGRCYAGQKMRVTVQRGKERMENEITLVKELEPEKEKDSAK
jgi:hypothetical protein